MIIVWSLFTIANAAGRTPQDLMIIRFFQGYFESCIFAGTQYILGSWYTKRELGKRTGLFTASGLAGGMFGGFLQTGIYDSMNGLHGLPGWRWLYIVSLPRTRRFCQVLEMLSNSYIDRLAASYPYLLRYTGTFSSPTRLTPPAHSTLLRRRSN